MKLEQRTILVTGGTSGIGLELARQLLVRGNTVIVTGRDQDALDAATRTLPGLHTFRSDVSDPQAITALHEAVLPLFPALDTLVNNAGIMRNIKLDGERSLQDVTREIEVNLSGPVRMVQQFLPHLLTRPGALIVNVSSGLAFIPFPAAPVYSATKAAIHSFTQSLRVQLRGTSVTDRSSSRRRASRRRCSAASSPRRRGDKRRWSRRSWFGAQSQASRRASSKSGLALPTC